MMPGENAGPADGPLLGYHKADRCEILGFAHEIHGVEVKDGRYRLLCVKA